MRLFLKLIADEGARCNERNGKIGSPRAQGRSCALDETFKVSEEAAESGKISFLSL